MNPKVKKLLAEKEKNNDKIAKCTARNEEIDKEVLQLENTDIIGLVRGIGMTPDQLAALIKSAVPAAAATAPVKEIKEDSGHAEE